MQRYDFFFRQKVEEGELDAAFEAVELAVNRLLSDFSYAGVSSQLGVQQQAPTPNLTVNVIGPGIAFDQDGQRIFVPSTQSVNCAVDENAVNTVVGVVGKSRILSIFIEYDRALSDPRLDGNAATVYYNRAESFVINVVQGSLYDTGTTKLYPALRGDQILLADIELDYGQTAIVNADIDTTGRRQVLISIPASVLNGIAISATTPNEALTQIADAMNDHIAGLDFEHAASAINYAGGAAWLNGATNPAATVEAQLDKIIADLSNVVSAGVDGAGKIGIAAIGVNWADATVPAAASVRAAIVDIITVLRASTGAAKIGIDALANWSDGTTNPAGTLRASINNIVTVLAAQTPGASGALRLGIHARTSWPDATTNVATTLFAAIDKIITDLGGSTGTAKIQGAGATSSHLNPQVAIGTGQLSGTLVVLANILDNIINDTFYERVLNASHDIIAPAAVMAGDGIVVADWSAKDNLYFAVRRVAASNDITYQGLSLKGGLTSPGPITVTSTVIWSLFSPESTSLHTILVGTKNPTSGGALLAYYSAGWTTATLPAPATTSGADLRDAIYVSFASRYVVCGLDATNAYFLYASTANGTWTAGTVTATAAIPSALATNGSSSVVAVGASGWIWYSSDAAIWSRVQIAGGAVTFTSVCWNPTKGRYYATTSDTTNTVYMSTDATGSAWTVVTLPGWFATLQPAIAAIACDAEGRMVFSLQSAVTFLSYIGCTADFFDSVRVGIPSGTAATVWVANDAARIRYRRGRFLIGDAPTGGTGAIVATRTVASLAS